MRRGTGPGLSFTVRTVPAHPRLQGSGVPRFVRHPRSTVGTLVAALAVGACSLALPPTADAHSAGHGPSFFNRTATYPVYLNRPAGDDVAAETVAEISAVSKDGRTLVYTDATGKRIGFLDISRPGAPRGLGTLSLAALGDAEDEPTSVAVVGGYVLVVVNTSASFTAPSGRVDVIRLADRVRVRSIDLGGQPDSIAVSQDGRHAAIAVENERDEEATPPGGEEGDLPQLPAGFVQVLDLPRSDPATWTTHRVELAGLPGLVEPSDPEPEYVSINGRGQLAVTLQENNAIALIDLAEHRVIRSFSTGTATVTGIDTEDDGTIDPTGEIVDTPREPDAVGWLDDRYLGTANEGDWKGGTRGWSVFDSWTGKVVWDAGNTLENLAVAHGLHNESRADNKGVEAEGLAVARYGRTNYAFVGSERSNFVAVYDISKPRKPKYLQLLPTTNGPEGILPIPSRGLLAVSSETDDASANVRASVSLFELGGAEPAFPQIVSRSLTKPIGWGALGALSAVPGKRHELVTVTDAAYAPTHVLTVDTRRSPALITGELPVKDAAGKPVGYDAEGIFARPQGGYWLAVEGATGPENELVRLDRKGVTQQVVTLPAQVAAGLKAQGFEGVTATTDRAGEHVFAVIQREVATDPKGVVRIGRYDVSTGVWTWFGYRLETTTAGDWIGLSEVTAVDRDTLAVVERDKLNGPNARIKRVYTVDLPAADPAPGTLPVLPKELALDLLPVLRSTHGWTQEKLEGFTIGGDGAAYAVTDNDGVDDATGETDFFRLPWTK